MTGQYCKSYATLLNQHILELSVYPLNTLQVFYRPIVDVHEGLKYRKNIFDNNLAIFRKLVILNIG